MIYLVGHSLGAHIGGLIGEYLKESGRGKISRITGLKQNKKIINLF